MPGTAGGYGGERRQKVSRDHYGVLGVSPTSEDVVIRAAYRALMRRYHPDADPSSEASQRAQAINAAYSVLSDPEKRARYDGSLAAQGLIKPDLPHRAGLARRLVPGPAAFIGLAALAATATMLVISPPIGVLPGDGLPLSAEPQRSRPAEPERPVHSTSDGGALTPPPSAPDAQAVPNAMLDPAEELVEPELPDAPGVRRARAEQSRQNAVTEAAMPPAQSAAKRVVPSVEKSAAPAPDSGASCRLGNGWAERAICRNGNLTALDRQYGLLYAQSLAKADETKRAALVGSRERFQQKRSACRSENCLTDTYIARLREVSDIMARGAQQ